MHTLNDISGIKTDIVEEIKHGLRCKGFDNINPYELGQYVDMVKDLAKAEKDCVERCYYESVVTAMHEGEDYQNNRMGYDHWRYSSGRFAPTGKGHYSSGYTPMQPHMPMPMMGHDDNYYYDEDRMGYPRKSMTNSRMGYPMDYDKDGQYGKAYREFDESRRHYHESKDMTDKKNMEHHADQHIKDIEESVRDIWNESSPEMKKKIKGDMSKLLAEMAI